MSSYLSPTFIIGSIRIGSVEGASCVNMGNNYPTDFTSHKKHNQGFGSVGGDHNKILGARSVLDDSDLLDMFNSEKEDVPDWVKEMLLSQDSEEDEPEDEKQDISIEKQEAET